MTKILQYDPSTSRRVTIRVALVLALAASLLVVPRAFVRTASAYPSVLNPSSGAHFGAFVLPRGSESKADAVRRLEGRIGRPLSIDHHYHKWNNPIPMAPQDWDKQTGHIPFVNWNARRTDGGAVRWSAIANGSQDAWIRERAQDFRAFGSPAYLTFHHEPEDDVGSLGTAQEFAAAFRRIVTVFRSEGVTNVAFVWTMMAWTFDGRSGRNPMDYYPGDGYVDLVGADGYNWYGVRSGEQWRSFAEIFASTRAFAISHGKPWMAVEYGVVEDPSQNGRKAQWFSDVLPATRSWPELAGVVYFDSTRDGNQWVSDSSSSAINAFGQVARDGYFTGGSGTPPPSPSPSPSPPPSPSPSPTTPPPSGALSNSLNAGPRAAAVTTSNSSASGTAFHGVTVQGGASLSYDTSHTMGAYAARHVVPTRGNAYYEWGGNLTTTYGRVYVWLESLPSGALRLVRLASGSGLRTAIDILRSGELRVVDSRNDTVAATRTLVATGRWVRIEWRVSHVQGTVEVRLFNDAGSTTPTVSFASGSGESIGSSSSAVQIGRSGSQSYAVTFWTDNPAISANGWLGPA